MINDWNSAKVGALFIIIGQACLIEKSLEKMKTIIIEKPNKICQM